MRKSKLKKSEWSLVVFTIFIQMAVGIIVLWGLVTLMLPEIKPFIDRFFSQPILLMSLVSLCIGVLGASTHLSQPLRVRFVTGNFKRSWLSRKALFGVVFGTLVLIMWTVRRLRLAIGFLDNFLIIPGILCGLILVY